MNNATLESPFAEMLDNFLLAQESRPDSEQGICWNVFIRDFEKVIVDTSIWSTFMRNPLGVGLVDETLDSYIALWNDDHDGVEDGTAKKLNQNFEPLIDENVQDKKQQQEISNLINFLIAQCGLEFFTKYNLSDVGSPAALTVNIKLDGTDPIQFRVNKTDMCFTYYFYQCVRPLQFFCDTSSPMVIDIGAGYGGVMAKMKKAFPRARCILLDLPEYLPVQTYYLNKVFPGSRFLYCRDWQKRGSSIFEDDFDFLIAPNWMINDIPEVSVDQVINMRSMMEMSSSVVSSYFKEIQRITKIGGLFACFNRYEKDFRDRKDIPGSSSELNMIKNYPYDANWQIVISQTSLVQAHIHDLILRRQAEKNPFPVTEALKSLPPTRG